VRAETIAEDFALPTKTLSTLGIMINELITNAMKHAFAGREGGTIRVRATRAGGRATISVEDDGIGMPEGSGFGDFSGLGLKLSKLLADQLDASLAIERGPGTRVVIDFALSPPFTHDPK
jgi:two-component sensor histidine kinase